MDTAPKKSISPAARGNSFRHALSGIRLLVINEPNAKLHAAATIVAVAAGFILHINYTRWAILVIAIAVVWVAEALNTCVERLCDFACDNKYHPAIKVIKDISAAAVLIAALASLLTGILIFIL